VAAATLAALAVVVPASAALPNLALLDSLQKGEWELRYRDGSPPTRICVRTGWEFIQLRHQGKACSRHGLDAETNEVTVHYSCKGDGYGRTSLRKETKALVQIESQGIAGGLPFQFNAEGRRVGDCR